MGGGRARARGDKSTPGVILSRGGRVTITPGVFVTTLVILREVAGSSLKSPLVILREVAGSTLKSSPLSSCAKSQDPV